MSLQRVQNETTSTEFIEWMGYLENVEPNIRRTEHYYLAQIAAEVRKMFSKKGAKVSIKDFLLKFDNVIKKKKEVSMKEQVKNQKSFWKKALGRR